MSGPWAFLPAGRVFLPEGIWQPVWASIGMIRRFWPGVGKKILEYYGLMA